jgi:hypothetical protein
MIRELDIDASVISSTRVYNTSALKGYDIFVHGFCNRYAWKCPTDTLLHQYNELTSKNHLEAGVGTGFLIDKANLPSLGQRLGILDFSKQCLMYSERRLERHAPEIYQFDILKPMTIDAPKFESIGINYVLHCVPGSFTTKGIAFANLKGLLANNGVLFGSTLLGHDVERNLISRALMSFYNRTGIFNNKLDDVMSLREALSVTFERVEIEIVGCCALFKAY